MATLCNAPGCGKPLPAAVPGKRARLYCDSTCRGRAYRANGGNAREKVSAADPAPIDPDRVTLAVVVRRQLEAADRVETVPGQLALELAQRLESAGTTASSVATLSKELRALLAEALAGTVPVAKDVIDEIGARREQKAATA